MRENGGITDDRYITDPLDMAEGKKQYSSTDIPTLFNKVWNHNTSNHVFLTHRYNVGFYKERQDSVSKDSIRIIEDFIPVTSFIHTLELDLNGRKYITQDNAQNQEYFENTFFGNDSIDNDKRTSIRNTFGISLLEGFNKWAKAGLTAFATHEYRDFTLPDSTDTGKRIARHYKENVFYVGGELIKKQGWEKVGYYYTDKNGLEIYETNDGWHLHIDDDKYQTTIAILIKYLHELQNAYFVATKKELEINL
jgi:hypothetical protein